MECACLGSGRAVKQQGSADVGQLVRELACGLVRLDVNFGLGCDVAGVNLSGHCDDGGAGPACAGHDRPLNRGSTSEGGQE
jgi:hypothetical protein